MHIKNYEIISKMTRIEIRMAIWLAHEKKDAYTGRLIENFDDLEIDHIIPKSIDENNLKDKINKYELGKEFTIHSLENLLPTFKLHNRQKSGIIFGESSERFFLAYAKDKKKKIEKELSKIIKNKKQKEKIQFKKSYKISETTQYGVKPTYFKSDTLVALNGFLPSLFDNIGSCAVEFYEMGTMISLNHDLISTLINDVTHSTLEKNILNYYNESTQNAFVIIGSSSLHLKKEAYDQTLAILGDFLTEYQKFHLRFENFWGIVEFEKWEKEKAYKIREIEQEEWDYLTSGQCAYLIDDQNNCELYYDDTTAFLFILDKDSGLAKCTLKSQPVTTSQVNRIALLWRLPTERERKLITEGKTWTAIYALNWINQVLSDYKKTASAIPETKTDKPERLLFYLINKIKKKLPSKTP